MELNCFGRRMQVLFCTLLLLFSMVPQPAYAADGGENEKHLEALAPPGTAPDLSSSLDLQGTVKVLESVVLELTVVTEQNTPITGARVALDLRNNYAQADSGGKVTLQPLFPGFSYTIYVSHSGYREKVISYTYELSKQEDGYPVDRMTVTLVREGGSSDSGSTKPDKDPDKDSDKPATTPTARPSQTPDSTPAPPQTTEGVQQPPATSTPTTGNGDTGTTPTVKPTIRPVYRPSSTVSPVTETEGESEGGLTLIIPEGSDNARFPSETILDSIAGGESIQVVDKNRPAGKQNVFRIPAFTDHDLELVGTAKLYVVRDQYGTYRLVIVVPQEETEQSRAGVPHNIVEAIRTYELDLQIVFEDDRTLDLLLSARDVESLLIEAADLFAEYDRTVLEGCLAYAVQTAYHGAVDGAVVSAEAYTLVQQADLGLKYRIYDVDLTDELWYEWSFSPASLQTAEAKDTDLFIWGAPEGDDPILHLTKGIWCQYVIINHDGLLPARAKLRVKNLEEFPADEDMTLVMLAGNRLDTVATSLQPDENGWYSWYLDHCSSYALLESVQLIQVLGREYSPLRVDKVGGWNWRLIGQLLLVGVLLLFLLFLLFLLLFWWDDDDEEEEEEDDEETTEHAVMIETT